MDGKPAKGEKSCAGKIAGSCSFFAMLRLTACPLSAGPPRDAFNQKVIRPRSRRIIKTDKKTGRGVGHDLKTEAQF